MKRLGFFAVFSLIAFMIIPVHADVTSVGLEKSFYTKNEYFTFVGEQDGKEQVFVIIRDATGDYKGMLSDVNPDQGEFSVIPREVSMFFKNEGRYNATAFTNNQTESNGIVLQLEFDGEKLFKVPEAVLKLKDISDKTVEVEKTITFTATLTDSSIGDVVFSLSSSAPSGATIDSNTGKFVWTPTKSHGNIQDVHYSFDVIATKGVQEDRETITITVKQAFEEPEPKPKPEPEPEPEPEPKTPTKTKGLAPFVDESKDPQSYVDRYNNEKVYKEWFDKTYPEYSSIYEAVGLEEPKELAPFVDPNIDPQYYIDRYNNEKVYKEWFDKTYPDITIYEAVGLDEPEEPEPVFGKCGSGTRLIDGVCTIFTEEEFGECGEGTVLVGDTCEIKGKKQVKAKTAKPWWQFW